MERQVGTVIRGIRAPIIREGDDLAGIVTESVLGAAQSEGYALRDRDIVAVTEAVLARAQGNYASVDDIAFDIHEKFDNEHVGVIFPILSRNRFAVCLKGIAKGLRRMTLMLSYPADEVGNHLISLEKLDEAGVDPVRDVLTEEGFRARFGHVEHPFTHVDYIAYYKNLVAECDCEVEVLLSNDPRTILTRTKNVLTCDIHSRERTKRLLQAAGAQKVYMLSDVLRASVNGSGYNPEYGLLGSNKATEQKVKLFPRDCQSFVEDVSARLYKACGKQVEVMVYGDGAFKDPVGEIWELADPVVSPAYTQGLSGTPNELKLKYLADNDFSSLKGDELRKAIKESILHKDMDLSHSMASQGTTPRRLTDLIGSLCDLTSGSGDKGTPIVHIQGYFDNYTSEK